MSQAADHSAPSETQTVLARTRAWLEKAVLGLNLCPFAHAAHAADRIRYCVSTAATIELLLIDLRAELSMLADAKAESIETTLLIHPHVLTDFYEYNAFLDDAEALVDALGLTGEIQIASFHPQYQFADTQPDDIENYTNRSPYPMLHLLREASVERAVSSMDDPAAVYRRNIETMRRLGHAGWRGLWDDQ